MLPHSRVVNIVIQAIMAPLAAFYAFLSVTSLATAVTALSHSGSLWRKSDRHGVAASHPARAARTHYGPKFISPDWQLVGDADPTAKIAFAFVFEGDYAGLTKCMERIAEQRLPWLSQEELATYVTPTSEAVTAIQAAIVEMGAIEIKRSRLGDLITVSTTVGKASKVSDPAPAVLHTSPANKCIYCRPVLTCLLYIALQYFAADFKKYRHAGIIQYKTTAYTIPKRISPYVSDITYLSTFDSTASTVHTRNQNVSESRALKFDANIDRRSVPSSCQTGAVTSPCYRALYGLDSIEPVTPASSGASVTVYVCAS